MTDAGQTGREGRGSWGRIFCRYPGAVLASILVVLAVVLDFTLTSVWHLIKYGTIHHGVANQSGIHIPSPIYHHTLKPNSSSVIEEWGPLHHTEFTNSLGFRDNSIREVGLRSDRYRILMMGDSFTEGVGNDYQQTFVGIFADALSAKGIEVLNAGVAGYSPAIYFKKAEYLVESVGLDFNLMVVFLDISDIADEVKSYEIRNGETDLTPELRSAARKFFDAHSTVIHSLIKLPYQLRRMMSGHPDRGAPYIPRTPLDQRYGIKHDRSLWTINQEIFDAYGRQGLALAQRHMDLLYDLLKRHRIGLVIAVHPWPDQIFYHDLDSFQVRFWEDWASRHSVKFVNLFPEFIKDGQDPKQVIAEYYIEGDTHWNAKGHHLVARRLLEELELLVVAKHGVSQIR